MKFANTTNERKQMKNGKLNGKVAFVTGANRGLGLETARELGEQGITVVLGSRDPKKGEVAAAKLRDQGITAESLGLMLPGRRTIRRLTITSPKNTGSWMFSLITPAF